jgi:hypothetical protein
MGSIIEFNDTLKLPRNTLPAEVTIGREYAFQRPSLRIFHPHPVRVFLVAEVNGKWNFLGKVTILEQTIDAVKQETRGIFRVQTLYPDDVRKTMNQHEAPVGKGYEI